MIVSFSRGFVFVAVPKTASHAVRAVLRPHLAANDWEQCVLFEERYFPVPPLAALRHGHISCRQLQPFLLPDLWPRFFTFAVVRDPVSRFTSFCRFFHRDDRRMQDAPLAMMKRTLADDELRRQVLLRPQSEFVCDEGGRLMVDRICRFETLQTDIDAVMERIGLSSAPLPRVNQTVRPPSGDVCDAELVGMIAEYYSADFELFGYSPHPVDVAGATRNG